MRSLHFDCFSGASGDMIVGALVDLGVEPADVRQALGGLELPGLRVSFRKVRRGGIRATQFRVHVSGAQPPRGLQEIRRLLRQSDLNPKVQRTAGEVFRRLCRVEARIHGVPVNQVHLHEVGAVDSIADVVAAAFCLDRLSPGVITASPLATGSGTVRCEHGTLPVPAPATLELLRGVPIFAGPVEAEMVTPTGAAILTTVARGFGALPPMTVLRTGMGAGSREHPGMPNVLRAVEGEGEEEEPRETGPQVLVVEANLDDMNPQDFGHLMERLFENGALDVTFTPVQMKKNRPGVLVTALAPEEHREAVCRTILRETTSIGLRYHRAFRWELERQMETLRTRFGKVAVKVSRLDADRVQISPEYDDCRRCARRHGVSPEEVRQAALETYRRRQGEGE
jgi:uncharacterized protein (TIGR00299 family) protein